MNGPALKARILVSHPSLFAVSALMMFVFGGLMALLIGLLPSDARTQLILTAALHGNWLDQAVIGFIAHSFRLPWLSWFVGLVIGTPFALLNRRMMRAHADLFIRLRFKPMADWYSRDVSKFMLTYNIISLMPMFAAGLVCWMIPITALPALMSAYVPYVILYPDIRRIYDAALANLKAQ